MNLATRPAFATLADLVVGGLSRWVLAASLLTALTSGAQAQCVTAVVITTQPVADVVCEGSTATFTVVASGNAAPTYQWQKNNVNLVNGSGVSGATTPTLILTNVNSADAADYRCRVTNPCGTVNSISVALDVTSPTVITTQPVAQTVCDDDSPVFSIAATGTGLTYQWQRSVSGGPFASLSDGPSISGTTTPTLTLTTVGDGGTNDGASFRCRVFSTACTTATSSAVILTVNPATVITTQPVAQTICQGSDAVFSVAATGAGLTYQWARAVPPNGFLNITDGAAFSGTNSPTLTVLAPADGGANDGSSFRCRVFSACGNVDATIVGLTVNPTTAITTQPVSQTSCDGSDAVFSVTATGAGLTYQWARAVPPNGFLNITDGAAFSGTNSPTLTVLAPADGGANDGSSFRCRVFSACGNVDATIVGLTVNPSTAIATQPVSQTSCEGTNVVLSIAAVGTGLTYQWERSVSGGSFASISNGPNFSGTTTATLTIIAPSDGSNNDGASFRCRVTGACGLVTSSAAVLNVDGPFVISSQPSNQTFCDGGNAVFRVTATGGGLTYQWQQSVSGGAFTNIINGGSISGATSDTLTIVAPSVGGALDGANFRCRVSNGCGNVNSNAATLNVQATTAITTQPVSQTICSGSNASFSVTTTGAGLSHQWQRSVDGGAFADISNGGVFSGAASPTLTLTAPSVAGNNNGASFRCLVTGTCGAVTSSEVTLTVNSPPAITTQPASQAACVGESPVFSITATGGGLTYQWRRGGVAISTITNPSAATAMLTLTTVQLSDTASYDCVISNGCAPSATSTPVLLTVSTPTPIWTALGAGTSGGASPGVYALAVLPGGDMLVGGVFNTAGGVAGRNNIARYKPSTGVWSALGAGASGGVGALAVLPGGDVIVGGAFTAAGGVAGRNNIARYNPSTGAWSAAGPGTNDAVYALAVLPSGDVIVGGDFTTAGGAAASNIARYNPSTGVWSALGAGTSGPVLALAVLPGGDVIVGGAFTSAGGVTANTIARYNPTTGVWSALGAGTSAPVYALAVLPGGDVIVGGAFNSAGGVAGRNFIARYNPSTGVWSGLGATGLNAPVYALAVPPSGGGGGDVIVGGVFTSAGGVAASRIARYSPTSATTGVWSALGAGANDGVAALAVVPGGDVLVGGVFTTAGGVSANRIARYWQGTLSTLGTLSPPLPQSVCAGATATFTVSATGPGPFTYQWRKDTIAIDTIANPSAATPTLTLTNVGAADAGSYDCVVSVLCASATSTAATLTIGSCACNPADIAATDGSPGPDGAVDNGDFSLFFTSFFSAECSATCGISTDACNAADLAATDGSPGADGCVDNGDFSLFFTSFFAGCP